MKQTTIQLFHLVILQVTKEYFHFRGKFKSEELVFLIRCNGKMKHIYEKVLQY